MRFREIPGARGYFVSDVGGEVRSQRTSGPGGGIDTDKWRRLRGAADRDGYRRIGLYVGDRIVRKYIHQLVLLAFIGPCPDGLESLHEDGDPSNDDLSNLKYGTHAENMADKIRHGTAANAGRLGGKNGVRGRKLTRGDVISIRKRISLGEKSAPIGALFGVSRQTIEQINNGQTWRVQAQT